MKKILLSLTVLTFGASAAFAQTETETETQLETQTEMEVETQQEAQEAQTEDLQIERLSNKAEASDKREIEMSELPAAVQEAFKNSEFADWEVSGVYETAAAASEEVPAEATETEIMEPATEDAAAAAAGETVTEEVAYEILLISKDMKDEIEDTQEAVQEENEDAIEDGEAAVSTENVKVEIPGVLLKYDSQGQLISQEDQKSETETNDQY